MVKGEKRRNTAMVKLRTSGFGDKEPEDWKTVVI